MAKDIYHETVKAALIKDGWIITDDPLLLKLLIFDAKTEKIVQWIE